MMNPDGTLMPLSWRQRLFNRDRQEFLGMRMIRYTLSSTISTVSILVLMRQLLSCSSFYFLTEKRLTAAKRKAEEVVEHVSGIPKKEASSRDVALIHFFMLENVHWFYRISLRMNLLGRQFCLFI